MGNAWIVTTPPTSEPVTLSDIKLYTRIDFSDDDSVLTPMISRARRYCETVTGRAFATQTITETFTIDRPKGGEVSGPLDRGPNWYQYQEQLGANPFGAAQFYFDLAMPPIQSTISTITVQTKTVAFDTWKAFPLITNPDGSANMYIDITQEPSRLYFMDPITANFWQFVYVCGYSTGYPLPPDLLQPLCELIAYWYDNRDGGGDPAAFKQINNKLLMKRLADNWL